MASVINLPTLQQILKLDTSQFDNAMKKASADSDGFMQKMSGAGSFLAKGFCTAVGAASAAVVGLGGYSVKVGGDFESSMSQVAATMGMTVDEINNGSESFEMLKDAAKEAGASTKYSAAEAGDALNYLALAGYDAEKACDVLPSVLNLAQAGALDLASASDMVTDAMSALNIEANKDNVNHFGDQLAQTASKSNTSVSQLGEAILTVGGTANYLAGGTNELNTALGILANNGIKGAEGGTHLRNAILSLSAPTETAQKALASIGLTCEDLQDASGNLLPLNEIMQKLNTSMDGLSQTEKANVLSKMFNKTDLTAINALLKDSGDSWDSLYQNIEQCDGACQNMADTMNNNLQGQMLSLQSACESFGIAIYEKLQQPLTDLVSIGVDSVRQLTDAFNKDGVDGLVTAAGNMLSGFIAQGLTFAPKIVDMAVNIVKSFISGLNSCAGNIANGATQIGAMLINGFLDIFPSILQLGANLIGNLARGIANAIPDVVAKFNDCVANVTGVINDCLPDLLQAGGELLASLATGIVNAIPSLATAAFSIVGNFVSYVIYNIPQIVQNGMQLVTNLAQGIQNALPQIASAALQCGSQILTAIKSVDWVQLGKDIITYIGNGIKNLITNLGNLGKQAAEAVHNTIQNTNWVDLGANIISTIGSGLLSMLSTLGSTALQVGQAALNAFKEIDWLQLGKDILTFIGSGLLGAVSGLLSIAKDVGTQALDAIKNVDWLQCGKDALSFVGNGIANAASGFISGAKNIGTQAINTIRNVDWVGVGKDAITFVKNGLTNTVSTLTNGAKTVATSAINTFKNSPFYDAGKTVLTTVKNGLTGAVNTLTTGVKSIATSAISTFKGVDWRSAGSTALNTLKNGLSGSVSTLTSAAKSLATSAKNAFQNTSFYSVGSNIVTGIKNGISNNSSSLVSKMKNLATSALSAAKNVLGIHSPSRVFRDEVGKMMAEGIGVGFDDEMKDVNKDIQGSLNTKFYVNPQLTTNIADRKALSGTAGLLRSIQIQMGNISVSGVLDKDAAEQVRTIADEQVDQFSDALGKYIAYL